MREPFYIVWADYYNPLCDCNVEKMLGCYRSQYRAQKNGRSFAQTSTAL